jgi:flagellar assembly protein FliH
MEELRETLEAEWQDKVDAVREKAYRDGYNEGHVDGYEVGYDDAEADLQQMIDAEVERLAADVAQLKTLWAEYIEASEPALLNLTIEIAEALLDAPLPESVKGASARAIAEAVEELVGAASLTVSLHPVDYQRLQEKGLLDQLNANHEQTLHWNPDPSHPEGDWSVESPTALIRHQKDEIIASIRQRLGAEPSARHDAPSATDDAA